MNTWSPEGEVFHRAERYGLFERLRRWWHVPDRQGQFLAAATDLADLERRMRMLDRSGSGAIFETFNH